MLVVERQNSRERGKELDIGAAIRVKDNVVGEAESRARGFGSGCEALGSTLKGQPSRKIEPNGMEKPGSNAEVSVSLAPKTLVSSYPVSANR